MLPLALALLGCWSREVVPECVDPHLWYAPDGSEDVYFGCTPPAGWIDTPPDADTGDLVTLPGVVVEADADTDAD
ncbi:MAG: hypothetical protein KC621_34305, partial [Myxococcales bacterium]|nr:hypothetical protein [Myxococcales bacterium]